MVEFGLYMMLAWAGIVIACVPVAGVGMVIENFSCRLGEPIKAFGIVVGFWGLMAICLAAAMVCMGLALRMADDMRHTPTPPTASPLRSSAPSATSAFMPLSLAGSVGVGRSAPRDGGGTPCEVGS